MSVVGQIVLGVVGKGDFGKFWRFLTYLLMAAIEALLYVLPYDPLFFILPNCTVAEKISIMHGVSFYVFVAISHIGPLYFPDEEKNEINAELDTLVDILKTSNKIQDVQIQNMLKTFSGNTAMLETLKKEMEEKFSSQTRENRN